MGVPQGWHCAMLRGVPLHASALRRGPCGIAKWGHAGAGLRKLLLATGCPSLPGEGTESSRAAKGPLPSWQTPLFCLSSESGQVALPSCTQHTTAASVSPSSQSHLWLW